MNSSVKLLLVPVFAGLLMVTGITAALAQSEVGGELGTGTTTESFTDGALVASVSDPSATSTEESEEEEIAQATGGRSSTRKAPYGGAYAPAYDPIIIIDGTSVAPSGELGTGGGFDPDAEAAIAAASLGDGGDNTLSPSDAVAFNNSQNPFLQNTDLAAATGDDGLGSAKVWTAVVLGLALLGLAGYAVNALISYRRENDL